MYCKSIGFVSIIWLLSEQIIFREKTAVGIALQSSEKRELFPTCIEFCGIPMASARRNPPPSEQTAHAPVFWFIWFLIFWYFRSSVTYKMFAAWAGAMFGVCTKLFYNGLRKVPLRRGIFRSSLPLPSILRPRALGLHHLRWCRQPHRLWGIQVPGMLRFLNAIDSLRMKEKGSFVPCPTLISQWITNELHPPHSLFRSLFTFVHLTYFSFL